MDIQTPLLQWYLESQIEVLMMTLLHFECDYAGISDDLDSLYYASTMRYRFLSFCGNPTIRYNSLVESMDCN